MTEKRWLYFALGLATVISAGAVTNQLVPLAPASGVALSNQGIIFPDGSEQTTAAGNPDPPCFNLTERFVNCGNGTVTDTVNGLIYLENANCFGTQNWPVASQSAAALADGQCSLSDGSRAGDWRLPTTEEWKTILDSSCGTPPKIIGNGSPSSGCYSGSSWASGVEPNGWYWTSTGGTSNSRTAAYVRFSNGSVYNATNKVSLFFVWPVRGGQ